MGILAGIARAAISWLPKIGLAAFTVNEIRNFTAAPPKEVQSAEQAAISSGVNQRDLKETIAATTYDQVEQRGQSPDSFWAGLTDEQRKQLEFSPESLRASMQRTKFLGITSAFMFGASLLLGGVAAVRGLPIGAKTLSAIAAARARGAGTAELLTIIEEGKIAGIAKVWVPGLLAGIAGAGGWLSSTMANNLNDVDLWGRINLSQMAADLEKAQRFALGGGGGGDALAAAMVPKTRIFISRQTDPKIAVGTIFQSTLAKQEDFKRHLDDAITDAADLKADVEINMHRWLKSLPGRIHYAVEQVLNPLDFDGNKLQGTWLVLKTGVRNNQGVYRPLDVIALGPIEPTVYRPTSKEIQNITLEIPQLLTSEEIVALDLPTYGMKITDDKGNIVPVEFKPPGVSYEQLVNDNGTIRNTSTGAVYSNPEDLAAALGILPHQIEWHRIKEAPTGMAPKPSGAQVPLAPPPPSTPPPPPASLNIYRNLRNDTGTIYDLPSSRRFATPTELAAFLGILPHQIEWAKITEPQEGENVPGKGVLLPDGTYRTASTQQVVTPPPPPPPAQTGPPATQQQYTPAPPTGSSGIRYLSSGLAVGALDPRWASASPTPPK